MVRFYSDDNLIMKLRDIKPLNEYYIGSLQPMSKEQVMSFFDEAKQERHHIVVKNEGPTAFIYRYNFDSRNFLFILVDSKTKEYYGHGTFQKLADDILQPLDIVIIPELRGNQLAPQLYSFVSKSLDTYLIHGIQLSKAAEKMWLKFRNKKLYNAKEKKFYELNSENEDLPKNDTAYKDQTWFYAWKETGQVLECYHYLGEGYDYDLFLQNKPCNKLGEHLLLMTPGTPEFQYYEQNTKK